jgi:hypothetical protein
MACLAWTADTDRRDQSRTPPRGEHKKKDGERRMSGGGSNVVSRLYFRIHISRQNTISPF